MHGDDLPEHVRRNRVMWDRLAVEYAEPGRQAWASDEPTWGIWSIPEREVGALPEVAGRDVIELGCGTAYWSAWLARRGARVAGVDNSSRQLDTARALQHQYNLYFPLMHGSAESVPFPDASFDLAISEYGASIWCDPYAWVPEAARLLRPGGHLIFLKHSMLYVLCGPDGDVPVGEQLVRDAFGLHRLEWSDDGSVEFALSHGEWISLFRRCGFVIERLLELRPGPGAVSRYTHVSYDWARRWPCEEIWHVRKSES